MHMRSTLNFPLFVCKYQVDVDKSILLVNTVVNESLQNTLFLFSCMLDELKLLSAALGVRLSIMEVDLPCPLRLFTMGFYFLLW
jgi:hypothetical protein